MLDRLPSELLHDILLLTLPPEHAYSAYRQRQDVLLACCLVSRQVCQVAQPLLWRVFRPIERENLPIPRASEHLLRHVRVLEVSGKKQSLERVFKAVKKMTNLVEARFEHFSEDFERKELKALSALHSLVLGDVTVAGSPSVVFPNLVSLTLRRVKASLSSSGPYLPSSSLPNIRALHLASTEWVAYRTNYSGGEAVLRDYSDLFLQLEVLQLPLHLRDLFPPNFSQLPVPVTVTVELPDVSSLAKLPSFVKHLHLKPLLPLNDPSTPPGVLEAGATCVNELIYYLDERFLQLETLSLPSQLHSTRPPPAFAQPQIDLLGLCLRRRIRVLWRLDSKVPADDYGVDREFWEYAKGLKRQKEIEGAEKSGEQ